MKGLLVISIGMILFSGSLTADTEKALIKQCNAINKSIEKLEQHRESGGSAKQMDRWKRRIHDKQDEYSTLYCRRFRFELD